MAEAQSAAFAGSAPVSQQTQTTAGCEHYRRSAYLVAPCCGRLYWCRLCHDAAELHTLDRFQIAEVQCGPCGHRQAVGRACEHCHAEFAEYFCSTCRLYDASRGQFHCAGCGLCRVGGRESTFHCSGCGTCWPREQRDSHPCRPGVSRDDCAVCLEDLHSARHPLLVPPCGHCVHHSCSQQMSQHGLFSCPTCNASMLAMGSIWQRLDKEVQRTEMPASCRHLLARLLCRDCQTTSVAPFHVLCLKCDQCGSYNTTRSDGPLYTRDQHQKLVPATQESDLDREPA